MYAKVRDKSKQEKFMKKQQFVKLDSRNRVCLTKYLKNPSELFSIRVEANDKIILEPVKQVPENGHWLFEPENRELLEELKASLKETKTVDRGSFKKYLKD